MAPELIAADDADAPVELALVLAGGGTAAIPTETFYALAVAPESDAGLRALYAMKGWERPRPVSLLIASDNEIAAFARTPLTEQARAAITVYWPGPLTLVLPATESADERLTGGEATIGLRRSAHPALQTLLIIQRAVTATSANRAGEQPLTTAASVADAFASGLDLIIDGGQTPGGPATTVFAPGPPARVIRTGSIDPVNNG